MWVLVLSSLMAVMIQYQSAKLGIVTGRSLPTWLVTPWGAKPAWPTGPQAELVAAATDLAEVIGGALALHLLSGCRY